MTTERLRPVTRPTARPTRFVRLRGLNCFEEVHKRILAGWALAAVAKYIQEDAKEYTDITRDRMVAMLGSYRESLPPGQLVSVRMPEVLHKAVSKIESGLDELAELEKLYKWQCERIEIDMATEKKLNKLFKGTGAEMYIAMRILKNRAELKMDLGIDKRHIGQLDVDTHLTADLSARYGREEVSKVINDPASRRKALNFAERLMRISKTAAEEVVDAESKPIDDPQVEPAAGGDESSEE
jgi:hypothetical protein